MQIYNIYVFLLQLKGHDRYLKTSRTYFIFQGHFKDFKDLWQPCPGIMTIVSGDPQQVSLGFAPGPLGPALETFFKRHNRVPGIMNDYCQWLPVVDNHNR